MQKTMEPSKIKYLPRAAKTKCCEKMKECLQTEKQVFHMDEEYDFTNIGFLENGLAIKQSSLPNAGYGVFATRMFSKWDIVCEYSGVVAVWDPDYPCEKSTHTAGLIQNWVIHGWKYSDFQGLNKKQNPGSMLNDPKCKVCTNCVLHVSDVGHTLRKKHCHSENKGLKTKARLFIVASKDITAGAELFLNYGMKYWKKMNARSLERRKGKSG